jgi:type IV secretory pathway VirB3-like protein
MEKHRTMTPTIRALNEPATICGLDWRFVFALLVFAAIVGLLLSKLGAILLFCGTLFASRLVTRREPQMFRIWVLSFGQHAHYDPGKR